MTLTDHDVDRIARRLADYLAGGGRRDAGGGLSDSIKERRAGAMLSAAEVAEHLGVDRGWVYEHAAELGAQRLGDGPRGRLRFPLEAVDLAFPGCARGGSSDEPVPASALSMRDRAPRPMRSAGRTGTTVELLPVHEPGRAA